LISVIAEWWRIVLIRGIYGSQIALRRSRDREASDRTVAQAFSLKVHPAPRRNRNPTDDRLIPHIESDAAAPSVRDTPTRQGPDRRVVHVTPPSEGRNFRNREKREREAKRVALPDQAALVRQAHSDRTLIASSNVNRNLHGNQNTERSFSSRCTRYKTSLGQILPYREFPEEASLRRLFFDCIAGVPEEFIHRFILDYIHVWRTSSGNTWTFRGFSYYILENVHLAYKTLSRGVRSRGSDLGNSLREFWQILSGELSLSLFLSLSFPFYSNRAFPSFSKT